MHLTGFKALVMSHVLMSHASHTARLWCISLGRPTQLLEVGAELQVGIPSLLLHPSSTLSPSPPPVPSHFTQPTCAEYLHIGTPILEDADHRGALLEFWVEWLVVLERRFSKRG